MLCLARRNSSASDRENDLAIAPFTWTEEKSVGFLFISPLKFCSVPHTHTHAHTHIQCWASAARPTIRARLTWDAPAIKGSHIFSSIKQQFIPNMCFILIMKLPLSTMELSNVGNVKNFSKSYFTVIIHYPAFLNWIQWSVCKLSLTSQVPIIMLWDDSSLPELICVCLSPPFLGSSSCFFHCYCTCLAKQT